MAAREPPGEKGAKAETIGNIPVSRRDVLRFFQELCEVKGPGIICMTHDARHIVKIWRIAAPVKHGAPNTMKQYCVANAPSSCSQNHKLMKDQYPSESPWASIARNCAGFGMVSNEQPAICSRVC